MYEEGLGVEKDLDKAITYYKRTVMETLRFSRKDEDLYRAKKRLEDLGVEWWEWS